MEKFSLQDKVCIFIWTLMLMSYAAEQDYFPQSRWLTWDEARNHCQRCFKDLVTLTPENIQTLAKELTSDHWIGLRKNFHTARNSSFCPVMWSRWANGDPLTFQNWYPGWPVLKSPTSDVESSPTQFGPSNETITENVTFFEFSTAAPKTASVKAACVQVVPDPAENYIEDSCVAMLSFGPWVEKNCSERLPFICYEDHLAGQVTVTGVTSSSANLTWLSGPHGVNHYRLEVKGDKELTKNLSVLTDNIVNLTAGTQYSVRVFPVKCNRDLKSQDATFYTIPNNVENLNVTMVTETSVSLNWTKPEGNVDFYLVMFQGKQVQNKAEGIQVDNLTPGSQYTFTVFSGVKNESKRSEGRSITQHTRPGKVSNLKVSNNTNDSLTLTWAPPKGRTTGFIVKAMNDSNHILFNDTRKETEVRVTGLLPDSQITLNVTAQVNNTLGDTVTVVSHTAPGPVSDLHLNTTDSSLTATWKYLLGNHSNFNVELQLEGENPQTILKVEENKTHFDRLKTAAKYTVSVYVVRGELKGPRVTSSAFTKPLPPTDVKVSSSKKDEISFQWQPPLNTVAVNYSVKMNSSFWGHSWSHTLYNKTNYTFSGLKSGTRYDFEVRTMVTATLQSEPATMSHTTDAEKREISLSMLCSSAEVLYCDKNTTRESVFNQLKAHFENLLGDSVFWELKQQQTEN